MGRGVKPLEFFFEGGGWVKWSMGSCPGAVVPLGAHDCYFSMYFISSFMA